MFDFAKCFQGGKAEKIFIQANEMIDNLSHCFFLIPSAKLITTSDSNITLISGLY